MDKKQNFDIGDDIFNPRRPADRKFKAPFAGDEDTEAHARGIVAAERKRLLATDDTEDTEGHVLRTYPKVAGDEELEVRKFGLEEEGERRSRS